MASGRGIGGVPSWAILIALGGAGLVLLGRGVLNPAYEMFGQVIRVADVAGGLVGLGIAVVTLAMVMWGIGQLSRLT